MSKSSFFGGSGSTSTSAASIQSKIDEANTAKVGAETAKAGAETAKAGAEAAQSASEAARNASQAARDASQSARDTANSHKTAAEGFKTDAEGFKTSAEASATNASASATTSTTAALDAEKLALQAEDSQFTLSDNTTGYSALHYKEKASDSAAAAAGSASTSAGHVTTASGHATTATTKAGEAATSASDALTAKNDAVTAKNDAVTAKNDAVTAKNDAVTAKNEATTQATTATTQANTATTQAGVATTQAGNSATSATAASNSASSAATAQSAAEAARDSALSALDSFDDRYLGVKSSAPSQDNDGNSLVSGALYFDSTSSAMKVYSGSQWLNAYASLSGALIANQNLSDLNNAATARTNLGLAAVASSGNLTDLGITDGTNGQALKTDGNGNFSFGDVATSTAWADITSKPTTLAGFGISNAAGNLSFGDSEKAIFGAGGDLELYHDGSNSYLRDVGTGHLNISGDEVRVLNASNNELKALFTTNGAAELYYDNAKKIETTSTGVSVTGDLDASGGVYIGGTNSLIYESAADTLNFRIGADGPYAEMVDIGGSAMEFGNSSGDLAFTSGGTERMRLSGGNFLVAKTSADGGVAGFEARNSGETFATASGTAALYANRLTNNGDITVFQNAGSTVGSVAGHGGKLQIGQGNANVQFSNASDAIIPSNGSGSVNDNALDLGTSSARFNDIHYGGVLNANASDYQIKVTSGSNQPWYLRSKSDGTFGVHLNGTGDIATFSSVGAASKGLNLDGGTSHNTHDATLHVTAADNSDWGIKISADSGKTDYGQTIRMPSSFNYAFHVSKGGSEHVAIDATGIKISASHYVWHGGNDGAGSGLDADLLDGYDSGENGGNKILRTASNGYLQIQDWINVGSAGIFSSTANSAHFRPNTATSYATWRTDGSRGGYDGILFDDGGQQSIMFDSNRNGGIYAQNGGRWVIYHNYSNNCLGVGHSATSSSYELYVSGDIYATGNITAYSDARAKENVETIDGALGIVEQMRGVYYNKIDNPDKTREMGFLAQELNAVEGASELVTYAEDIDQYSVSYGNTAALLVEAVKELSAEVKTLKAEIEELKKG